MAFIHLHHPVSSTNVAVQPSADWPAAPSRATSLNGELLWLSGGTSTGAAVTSHFKCWWGTCERVFSPKPGVFDPINHAPNSPDLQRVQGERKGSIIRAEDACTADFWRRWIMLWELAAMEMSTSELARLTVLHFQGSIYHLQEEPPAQIMWTHRRGAHCSPLIIQTDTRAVMDTPAREAPKIQRDDCLPRIRCFMNKKSCYLMSKSCATSDFADKAVLFCCPLRSAYVLPR